MGASSGIGRACAGRLAERGYEVLAGVRSESAAEAVKAMAPDRIRPLILDVTDQAAIDAAAVVLEGEPLAGLVNSAGLAVIGPLELISTDDLRRQFEVNVIGLMAVTRAFLPALRQARGRIVNIGSIAGRSALPGTGAYDASKFAIEALTDSLRMELRDAGVFVSVIEPGAVATPIWDKTEADIAALKDRTPPERYQIYERLMTRVSDEAAHTARNALAPEAVALAVEHALTARRPKTRYPLGGDARFWLMLNLLPDRLRDWLIMDVL